MDTPERHLREWIADYYYGQMHENEDAVDDDADALLAFMEERGWRFVPVPR